MAAEFKFDLQQVSESDQACVDGVCFVPIPEPSNEAEELPSLDGEAAVGESL